MTDDVPEEMPVDVFKTEHVEILQPSNTSQMFSTLKMNMEDDSPLNRSLTPATRANYVGHETGDLDNILFRPQFMRLSL